MRVSYHFTFLIKRTRLAERDETRERINTIKKRQGFANWLPGSGLLPLIGSCALALFYRAKSLDYCSVAPVPASAAGTSLCAGVAGVVAAGSTVVVVVAGVATGSVVAAGAALCAACEAFKASVH